MWIAIKLLLGNSTSFIKKHWRIALAILLVIAAYFWYNSKIKEAFESGVETEAQRTKDLIKAEDERNREFEKNLAENIAEYVQNNREKDEIRVEKETKRFHTIEQIIKDSPNSNKCLVDQEIIDERNKIRALGPKPLSTEESEEE